MPVDRVLYVSIFDMQKHYRDHWTGTVHYIALCSFFSQGTLYMHPLAKQRVGGPHSR